jgi:hypothetical protein
MTTTTTDQCCDICTLNHATDDHYSAGSVKVKAFRHADLTDAEKSYINELWHLSRVESYERHARLLYVAKWFKRKFTDTDYSNKAIWLAVDEETRPSFEV